MSLWKAHIAGVCLSCITVRDTKDKRHPGIEIIYSGVTHCRASNVAFEPRIASNRDQGGEKRRAVTAPQNE